MTIAMYGLLHLAEGESSAENFAIKDFDQQVSLYVRCATTLANSLRTVGVEFTLLTNQSATLASIAQSIGSGLPIVDIPCRTIVPHGARFFSAHFKLDAFRYLASLNADYVCLCDLDMVCINPMPRCLSNNIELRIPMCYDISDQVIPAYGHDVIIRDLETLHGSRSEGRWCGGEFLSGAPAFFERLCEVVDKVYDNYLKSIGTLHHVGDEAVTSAALELLRRAGTCVADVGTLGIVGRYWNSETLHLQKSPDYYQGCFLLHAPADKQFLASMAGVNATSPTDFGTRYAHYRRASSRSPKRVAKRVLAGLRTRKVLPPVAV